MSETSFDWNESRFPSSHLSVFLRLSLSNQHHILVLSRYHHITSYSYCWCIHLNLNLNCWQCDDGYVRKTKTSTQTYQLPALCTQLTTIKKLLVRMQRDGSTMYHLVSYLYTSNGSWKDFHQLKTSWTQENVKMRFTKAHTYHDEIVTARGTNNFLPKDARKGIYYWVKQLRGGPQH